MEAFDHLAFANQCEQQLRMWQQALRLQDWIITLQFWPHEALGDSVARTNISKFQKSAVIALRYPHDLGPVERDWPAEEAGDYDMSLVHELLHILLHDMDSSVEWAEEQVCNIVSRAIVHMYRNGQPQGPPPSPPAGGDVVHKTAHPGHYL